MGGAGRQTIGIIRAMSLRRVAGVLLASGMLAAALSAQAPTGYRTHSDADSGLTFHYPVEFQEIPMPPTESLVKARYGGSRRPTA